MYLKDLIDLEYPSQKLYQIIQDIYNLNSCIRRGENTVTLIFQFKEDLQMKLWIIKGNFQYVLKQLEKELKVKIDGK